VLEYKRRFNNLSMFAQLYVPTEQHMIKKWEKDNNHCCNYLLNCLSGEL
jgi:hypothetical protein